MFATKFAASSVELTREILSAAILPSIPLSDLSSRCTKKMIFDSRTYEISLSSQGNRSLSLLSAFIHASHVCVCSFGHGASNVSISDDDILTSRSRYWFFISISKPFLAAISTTPGGVTERVNPLTRQNELTRR